MTETTVNPGLNQGDQDGVEGLPPLTEMADALAVAPREEMAGQGGQLTFTGPGTEGETSAMLVKQELRGRYLHTDGLGWMSYNGKRWEAVEDKVVLEVVRKWVGRQVRHALTVAMQKAQEAAAAEEAGDDVAARRATEEKDAAVRAATAWRVYESAAKMGNVAKIARGIDGVSANADEFDTHHDLFNAWNGVIDLATGNLLPHDPAYRFTRVSPTPYAPGATHRDWDAALRAIPADSRPYMQLRLGQAITGHVAPDDAVLFGTGGGENGKSTLFNALIAALGLNQYVTVMTARVIAPDAGKEHPDELMALRGARLVLIEELPEGKHLSVQALKDLTQPQLKAHHMHKSWVTWSTTHTLFVNCNPLPLVAETDHGTWRRLLRLRWPFTYRKPQVYDAMEKPEPTDRRGEAGLRERLREGNDGIREAVLVWLVEGARRWYQGDEATSRPARNLGEPPARVTEDTLAWQERANPLVAFCREHLAWDGVSHVRSDTVNVMFAKFMQGRGRRQWSAPTVTERFAAYWAAQGRDAVRKYTRRSDKLSVSFVDTEVTQGYQAWHGLRWVTNAEADIEAMANGLDLSSESTMS